jgi:hypothetical protein
MGGHNNLNLGCNHRAIIAGKNPGVNNLMLKILYENIKFIVEPFSGLRFRERF